MVTHSLLHFLYSCRLVTGSALERWTNEQRRVFGIYLLYTALLQLQLDGYKPLRRIDICD